MAPRCWPAVIASGVQVDQLVQACAEGEPLDVDRGPAQLGG